MDQSAYVGVIVLTDVLIADMPRFWASMLNVLLYAERRQLLFSREKHIHTWNHDERIHSMPSPDALGDIAFDYKELLQKVIENLNNVW